MKEFLDAASLREHPTDDISSPQMLTILLADYELIIRELREDITTTVWAGDDGNADFLTAIMEAHEKVAWMMRATLSEW